MLNPSSAGTRRRVPILCGALALLVTAVDPIAAQVELTVHGGVQAARTDRSEGTLDEPSRGISLMGAPGEATTFGLRVGTALNERWDVEGGVAWSRNLSSIGTVSATAPDFETHTIFASATARASLTRPGTLLGVSAGAGPALVVHQGSGSSVPAREADLGAVVTLAGALSLDANLAFRLDLHQYFFSSDFSDAYRPPVVGVPLQPAGARFRRESVLLAGFSWRGD